MKKSLAAIGLVALSASAAFAAAGGAEAKEEITDQFIEQRKQEMDETWRKVEGEAEKEFSEAVQFHTRMKDERLSFEKQMVEKRKGFLDGLKGMKPESRRGAWKDFVREQQQRRQDFARGQREKREAFHRQRRQEREDIREEVHKKHHEMREERREEMRKIREQKQGEKKG